jgi:hypothetical protein
MLSSHGLALYAEIARNSMSSMLEIVLSAAHPPQKGPVTNIVMRQRL